MGLQPKSVPGKVWVFLVKQALVLEACLAFLLFCISLLVAHCLLHVHGKRPVCLNLEHHNVHKLFIQPSLCGRDQPVVVILLHLLLVAALVRELENLPQSVDLPDTVLMVPPVIRMSEPILALGRFDKQKRADAVWLK